MMLTAFTRCSNSSRLAVSFGDGWADNEAVCVGVAGIDFGFEDMTPAWINATINPVTAVMIVATAVRTPGSDCHQDVGFEGSPAIISPPFSGAAVQSTARTID